MFNWLIIAFVLLAFMALPLLLFPLRKNYFLAGSMALVFFIALIIGYQQWGGWVALKKQAQREAKRVQLQAALKKFKNPAELINKLQLRLQQQPNSAKGWYLLGKLYAIEENWVKAREAFAKAKLLKPNDEKILVNYAQSLWQLNQQTFNPEIREIFVHLLQKNSQQPDALAMLAMDAYLRRDYEQAIFYWQKLLQIAPAMSEEAQAIKKAIAKAELQQK